MVERRISELMSQENWGCEGRCCVWIKWKQAALVKFLCSGEGAGWAPRHKFWENVTEAARILIESRRSNQFYSASSSMFWTQLLVETMLEAAYTSLQGNFSKRACLQCVLVWWSWILLSWNCMIDEADDVVRTLIDKALYPHGSVSLLWATTCADANYYQ